MNMLENTLLIRSVAKVNSDGLLETFTKENTKTMKEMAMEKWCGPMEANILGSGSKEFNTVMVK